MLNAPLDWPDCCALCSNIDGDGISTEACTGWSFHPATGSCQLMTDVSLAYHASISWGVNETVHGYPGYFEAPVTGCWRRTRYDLCGNMNLSLLIPGVVLSFIGFICIWRCRCIAPSETSTLFKELLVDERSRLQKAFCMEVTVTTQRESTGKGGYRYATYYKGTFMTRDGSLFVISDNLPPALEAKFMVEQKMLKVLFSRRLKPLADPAVAAGCQTPQGLRSQFAKLLRSAPRRSKVASTETIHCPDEDVRSPRLDCLLLVGDGQPQEGQPLWKRRQRQRYMRHAAGPMVRH